MDVSMDIGFGPRVDEDIVVVYGGKEEEEGREGGSYGSLEHQEAGTREIAVGEIESWRGDFETQNIFRTICSSLRV